MKLKFALRIFSFKCILYTQTDIFITVKQCNVRFAFESRLHKHNRSARHIELTGTLESIASDEDLEASDEGTHGHMLSHMDVYTISAEYLN